jgi:hypothetical protein
VEISAQTEWRCAEGVDPSDSSDPITAAKTVNNVLTVLSVMLKTAVEWETIDQLPCSIRLLPIAGRDAAFHDFGAYERLLEAALSIDSRTYLIAWRPGESTRSVEKHWRRPKVVIGS